MLQSTVNSQPQLLTHFWQTPLLPLTHSFHTVHHTFCSPPTHFLFTYFSRICRVVSSSLSAGLTASQGIRRAAFDPEQQQKQWRQGSGGGTSSGASRERSEQGQAAGPYHTPSTCAATASLPTCHPFTNNTRMPDSLCARDDSQSQQGCCPQPLSPHPTSSAPGRCTQTSTQAPTPKVHRPPRCLQSPTAHVLLATLQCPPKNKPDLLPAAPPHTHTYTLGQLCTPTATHSVVSY